ncbi:MAG: GxxExxY protein [Bacteroidetes bacterium]|nr:GxxExxY protein [Bacteroidota bacterium]
MSTAKRYNQEFSNKKYSFKEQVYAPLIYDGKVIEKSFLDFIVEEKVVVEIKKDTRFAKGHIDQVNRYLKATGLKLALLINFSKNDIVFKRLVNITIL